MSFLKKKSKVFRVICGVLVFLLIENNLERVSAQPTPFIPPGQNYFVDLSAPYSLPVLRGMRVYPSKPFEFDFMVGSGDRHTIDQKETALLIKYFLTCLTIPEEDLWVNLSPYESGRIIPDELALTNAGNTLLEQDKLLKQLASSLTYPESRLGKEFWGKVYKQAYGRFGTTNLPINTYNKVWIVPDKAIVYDMGNSALIGETHLKVLLEEDYLALKKHQVSSYAQDGGDLHRISSIITKEIILPELEKEINEGKNFAPVRQIFHSMVLAAWFKRALRRNVLSNFYVDKKKISGIDGVDRNAKEEIYKQYLRIYKKGAYNYIREDVDPITQQVVPRKYFSGGLFFGDLDKAMRTLQVPDFAALVPLLNKAPLTDSTDAVAKVELNPIGGNWDSAQLSKSVLSRLLLTVALSLPFAAGRLAYAATINPNTDGTLRVQVDKSSDTFGGILRQARYKGPLWGPNGVVTRVGKVVEGRPDIKPIVLGHSFNIPAPARITTSPSDRGDIIPVTQSVQETASGQAKIAAPTPFITSPRAQLETTPAPQLDQQLTPQPVQQLAVAPVQSLTVAALPAAPVPIHFGKKFYLYTGKLPAIAIPEISNAGIGGYVQDLDENKTTYAKGERILTIKNFELESRIAATKAILQDEKDLFARLEKAEETQAASENQVEDARKEVQQLENQLANDTATEALGRVTAPDTLTIRDLQINNGASVREGSSLFSYFDGDRIRLDINLPTSVHSNDFDLTLDGKPVKSIISVDWMPTPSPSTAHLSLIVTPANPIAQGEKVSASLKVYSPDKNFNKLLDTIVANGGTSTEVGKIETYRITATADGSLKPLAREGDKVKAGQIVAQIDALPTSYRTQLQQVNDEITIIDQQLKESLSSPGTVGVEEINKLKAEESKWSAEANRLQDLIPRLDVRAPKDGVIVSSAEQSLGGVVKSGEEIFSYNTGTVFLGDINNPQNGILFPSGSSIKHGDPVLVRTREGVRLIGEVTNVNQAFSPDVRLANQSVEVKVVDPQHALRTGMFVNVSLLDKKNQDIARRVLSQENSTQASSSPPPPPPPNDRIGEMAQTLMTGQNYQNGQFTPVEPATFFPAQGPSVNLSEIEKRVKNYNLTAVTQRYVYLQKQLAEKYPNAKSLSIDFNVYTSGGKTYFGGGLAGQLPNIAINIATGNAYGAAAPLVYSYFLKIANIVTHQKAKQIEFAKIQTELALLEYQTAVYERAAQAKNAGIDLGAQQQNIALLEQLIRDLEKGRKAIADRMNVGVSTEEQLRAFDDTIAEAREAESRSQEDSGKYTVELNTLTGQKDLHEQVVIDLPWNAEFTAPSSEQENDWINKLVEANPQVQQARAEIAAVKQKIKLQKIKGWDVNTAGVYSTGAINNSITEPAIGGGEEYRASLMSPGENAANGITIPLFNGPKKIDDKIIAQELQKKQAELDLKISTLKGELAVNVSALRELSKQIKETDEAYQNALKWWELKARFMGTLYSAEALVKEREAMNKWAMKKIELERQYFETQENLKKLAVMQSEDSLAIVKAVNGDKAQLASFFKRFVLAAAATLAFSLMPLNAQQGAPDSNREFNAWSSKATLPGGNSRAGNAFDPNILNRGPAVDNILAQYRGTREDIDRLENIITNLSSDERQMVFNFIVGRHDLRFLIQLIGKADKENKGAVVSLAYQSLGDILTDHQEILDGLHPSDFVSTADYPDQTKEAQKVFLTFIARNPDGIGQTNLLLSGYWRTDELARIYNELESYLSIHPGDGQAQKLKSLIFDVMVRKIFLLTIDKHFTPGQIQNANSYSPFLFDDNTARGRIYALPNDYRLFFNSPDWRQEEGVLRPDLLNEARQTAQGLIDQEHNRNQSGATPNPPVYTAPNFPAPQDSLALFSAMDFLGQQKYIAQAKNSELARILESPATLQDPLLFSDVLNRLMADKDGRLLVMQAYGRSSDEGFLRLIEAAQDPEIIKQDAEAIKNPAATGIFRKALERMYVRLGGKWLMGPALETYSSIEMYSLLKSSPAGSGIKAQVNLIATKWALTVLLKEFPGVWEKDSFIAGHAMYSSAKYDCLNRIAEKINSLNSPEELEDYLKQQAAQSPDDKKTIDELDRYRDAFAAFINANNQEIINGSWWMKGVEWLYHTGLFLSISWMSFGVLYTLLPGFMDWQKRKFAGLDELMDLADLEYLNSRGKGEKNGVINENKVEPSVAALLVAWDKKLTGWANDEGHPVESLLNDQQLINNFADEIIRLLPYTPDLIDIQAKAAQNQAYQDSFAYFARLANKTSKILSDRLKSREDITASQRERFWQKSERMLLKMVYVQKYLDILQGRVNINTAINEHFPKGDLRERVNAPPTWLLGYGYLSYKPRKKLAKDLKDLMDVGNLVIQGLYNDIDSVINVSQQRLNEVILKGKRFGSFGSAASSDHTRQRSWLSRWFFLIPTSYFVGKSIIGYLGIIPFNLLDVFFSIGTLCLTFANYWSPILSNTRLAENRKTKEIMMRLYNKMKESLGFEERVKNWKSLKKIIKEDVNKANTQEEIIRLANKEGEEYRIRELRAKSVDVIVLIVKDSQEIHALKDHLEGLRGNLIREDVQIEAVPWGYLDGDTFLQTLLKVDQDWKNARKMFIFVGNDVKPDDPRLELSIKNLYGASASMPQGGLVMANARDVYLGPAVQHVSGASMTFGTVWSNLNDLHNRTLSWVVTDIHLGRPDIRKIFKDFDLRSRLRKDKQVIAGSSTMDILNDRGYDLSKGALQQFSASNGVVLMEPQAVEMFTSIAKELEGARLRLNADLFVPILMATAQGFENQGELAEEILAYVQAQRLGSNGNGDHSAGSKEILNSVRKSLEDTKAEIYLKIAEIAKREEFQGINASAHLPPRSADIFEPNPSYDRVNQLIVQAVGGSGADAAAIAAPEDKTKGGIDLNFQPQFIQRFSPTGSAGIPDAGATANMPAGFKGFNFNIIRFTSQLSVNNAFQLMFTQ